MDNLCLNTAPAPPRGGRIITGRPPTREMFSRRAHLATQEYWTTYVNMRAMVKHAAMESHYPMSSTFKTLPLEVTYCAAPAYSIQLRPWANVKQTHPLGPGSYSPHADRRGRLDWCNPVGPKWVSARSRKMSFKAAEVHPGPGTYTPQLPSVRGGTLFPRRGVAPPTFSQSIPSASLSPGPADYEIAGVLGRDGPSAYIHTATPSPRLHIVSNESSSIPGPGTYTLPSTLNTSRAGTSMGSKLQNLTFPEMPGPGSYNIKSDFDIGRAQRKGITLKGREALEHGYT